MAESQKQQMSPYYPNYGPINQNHYVTIVSYPTIDNHSNPPLGHSNGAMAREYARALTERCRAAVEVIEPQAKGGLRMATYRNGLAE